MDAGQDRPSVSPLKGAWLSAYSNIPCYDVLAFDGVSAFSRGIICTLADGTTGLQLDKGMYVVIGGQFQWEIDSSTCPVEEVKSPSGAVTFSVNPGGPLTVTFTDAIETFQLAASDPTSSGIAFFGCFHGDVGKFTRSPLAPF